jgi:hypothetical protein
MQVADAPLTAEQRKARKEYQQALRNLPTGGVDVLGGCVAGEALSNVNAQRTRKGTEKCCE